MQIELSPIAHGRASARRHDLMSGRVRRFHQRYRSAVAATVAIHPRLADLAMSFPALLFSIAVPRPGRDPDPVRAAVIEGASLENLSELADLPLWTRKLMPETFVRPIGDLPPDRLVCRQIPNHLPRSPRTAARWLERVGCAWQWASADAAVWTAREFLADPRTVNLHRLRAICLYIWFSQARETCAGRLIERPWTPSMRYATARLHAKDWIETIVAHANLGESGVESGWLSPGTLDGLEFRPLLSAHEVCEEAGAMRHCVRRSSTGMRVGRHRIWSVRRNGERVATLQLGYRYGDPLLTIVQLRGPDNATIPIADWWIVRKWLHSHDLLSIATSVRAERPLDRSQWLRLWRPYWVAKRRLPPWLPLTPSMDTLYDLRD